MNFSEVYGRCVEEKSQTYMMYCNKYWEALLLEFDKTNEDEADKEKF